MRKKVVIAGGSGFLGKVLSSFYQNKGYLTTVFTRGDSRLVNGVNYVQWDGKTFGEWNNHMNHIDILINLTGKSVDCRYTEANKAEILNSRVDSTIILGKAIRQVDVPPVLWLNASTATIFESSYDKVMTEEDGEIGDDFSMNVAKSWEKALFCFETPETRKVALRISLVLGRNEGILPVMRRLTYAGLGGKHGHGRQKFAWIHIDDLIEAIEFIVDHEDLEGPVICSTPTKVTNKEFMAAVRKRLGVPFGLPNPTFLLKMGAIVMRTEAELILKSRYVSPKKLLDAGFQFKFTNINEALSDLL